MAKVLILEQDPIVRQLLEIQVRQLAHDPIVGGGDQPLAPAACDIALLEPTVPGALALAGLLRRERPWVRLIFVSTKEPTPETAALKPETHLVKPFRVARLERALNGALC